MKEHPRFNDFAVRFLRKNRTAVERHHFLLSDQEPAGAFQLRGNVSTIPAAPEVETTSLFTCTQGQLSKPIF